MTISRFFIDRPIFASVLSIVFIILGGVSFIRLPIAQYPEIAPPVINVTGQYPGANAEVVATTVVAPIEEQINGVENMLYMSSNATADGRFSIAVTFDIGTNLDIAQVQVQNRVGIAQPRLPVDVRQIGVTVTKSSPDLMMVVHLFSPDQSRNSLFISNYATLEVKDQLLRVDGVGSITVFGSRDYAMRVWLDPGRLQSLGMTATDVTQALQAQNIQVASGVLNQPPVEKPGAFQVAVQTLGRLANPEEFSNIVVKQTAGAVVRLKDVATIQLAAQDYSSNSYLGKSPAVALAIFQRPGSNALATADNIVKTMEVISKRFPAGIQHGIVYNPTEFIRQSVNAVIETILEAVLLVVLVIIIFLQTWRAAVIPIVAIPVSLIGTFFFMATFGFTLNNLSLFGLVLAVGIVVDDAIVVVENAERNIAAGLSPREAAIRSMDEVGTALIAIALVLCAVFVPSAFITGISGQFYRQFALTIAGATIVSCTVSLTLSPALCAMLLKPHDPKHRDRWWEVPIHGFFRIFNFGFDKFASGYGWIVRKVVRYAAIMLIAYVAILAYGLNEFRKTPTGFIPQLDRGIIIVAAQLPPGAALARTDAVMRRALDMALEVPGVSNGMNVVGFSGATFTNAPNAGAIFLVLDPWEVRAKKPGQSSNEIQAELFKRYAAIQEGLIIVIQPPPVSGIGNAGGFRMMIEDRAGRGPQALQAAVVAMMGRAQQTTGVQQVFSLFETSTPQLYLDIDRVKAQMLGVNVTDVFAALQIYLGSAYVNDFNLFGKTFRVTAQAGDVHRNDPNDVLKIRVRNQSRRNRAARLVHHHARHFRAVSRAALQSLSGGRARRQRGARLQPGAGDRDHGEACRRSAARGLRLRVDHARVPAVARRKHRGVRLRARGRVRVPGARRAIRKPDAPARRHPDRADVPGRRDRRCDPARLRQQHPHAGGLRRADRPCGEERDPDRGVRQAARGSGTQPLGCRGRGRAAASAADPDDLARVHLRRDADGVGHRRRCGVAPEPGHDGVLRHDRRDRLRARLHAGVLCRVPLDCGQNRAAEARSGAASGRVGAANRRGFSGLFRNIHLQFTGS